MAWNEKINEKDFESRLVKNLADRPNVPSTYGAGGLSAKELKERFDKSAHFLKDKINAIIEALGGVEALTNIRITDESGKEVSAKEWIENKLLVASLENPGSKIDISSWVESANKLMSENAAKVGFTDYATFAKAGVVKISPTRSIGITNGFIELLKANEEHIAERGANLTDYAITASKINAVVKAALTDKNKMVLADNDKATARETLGAASTEEVNGMHLALSDGLNKANTRTDGLKIVLDYDSELYKFKLRLVDKDGVDQSVTNEIDLPLESVVIDVIIPDDGENFVLVLNNGKRIEIPTEVLLRGFVTFADLENYATKEDLESVNIELAPTLNGNEADKAPSVQAVNEGLQAHGGLFANALKGTKEGAEISLPDISPVLHKITMRVKGSASATLSNVKVTARSRNLFNPDDWVTTNPTIHPIKKVLIDGVEYLQMSDNQACRYTVPGDSSIMYALSIALIRKDSYKAASLKLKKPDGSVRQLFSWARTDFGKVLHANVYGGDIIYGDGWYENNVCIDLSKTMLQLSPRDQTAIFVPYAEPKEYAVTEDGTVMGVMSTHSVFTTDTEGTTIYCEYNRDTTYAFNELKNAIISTGGNV